MKFSRRLQILLLIFIPLVLYAPILRFPFIWDDESQIVNNEVLRQPSRLLDILTSSTFDAGGGQLVGAFYRPLVSISNLLNYQVCGLNPTGFHIFQIVFHVANGLLLFFVLKKVLSNLLHSDNAENISFVISLLFLVHPIHVESVVYIGSIGEVLYTFFAFAGFAVLLTAGNHTSIEADKRFAGKLPLFFVSVFLALLAKEAAVVIIPVTVLYLWLFVRPKLRSWFAYAAGSLLTLGAYCLLRFGIAHVPVLTNYSSSISNASFGERMLTLSYIVFRYITTLIIPSRLLIYQNEVIRSVTDIRFWGSLIVLILSVVLIVCFLKPKTSKLEYFFLGWFLLGIVPVLNIVPLDMTIAERWLYFPSVGFIVFTILILQRFIRKIPSLSVIVPYVVVIVLIAFSVRTVVRAQDWRSATALYSHDVRFVQDSPELMNNHSLILIENHQYDEAQVLLERALILNKNYFQTYINLGNVYQLQGKTEKAIDMYLEVIQRFNINFGYANLASLLMNEKRYDEARDVLTVGRQLFPTFKRLTFLEIILEFKTGNNDEALTRMQELLQRGVVDRDIQELLITLDQFQIPREVLITK